jgi:hypothetical protein
MNAFIKE